jgi:hypothetical protein
MTPDELLTRLRSSNPVTAERAERAAGAPWATALRARLLATDPAPTGPTLRRRRTPWPLLATAALLLAGGGTLAANELRNAVESAPDTPAGAEFAESLLEMIRGFAPGLPETFQRDAAPIPESARVVFSRRTPRGEYTVWRARTEGGRGRAFIFSSSRTGIGLDAGIPERLPPGPFVAVEKTLASETAREMFGRVSADVTRVRVVLKNGRRAGAVVDDGWFVFTQDFGHARPIRVEGLDRHGRVVATWSKGL